MFRIVYHVENPNVPGLILKRGKFDHIPCTHTFFLYPVSFRGNSHRGKARYWLCSRNLLFKSSKEAKANNKII